MEVKARRRRWLVAHLQRSCGRRNRLLAIRLRMVKEDEDEKKVKRQKSSRSTMETHSRNPGRRCQLGLEECTAPEMKIRRRMSSQRKGGKLLAILSRNAHSSLLCGHKRQVRRRRRPRITTNIECTQQVGRFELAFRVPQLGTSLCPCNSRTNPFHDLNMPYIFREAGSCTAP